MITDKIQIILADITKINTDAIVCSSNKSLFKGSGLSKFIYEAAGAISVEGEALKFAPLDEGAVCFTQGYNLPARYIIHTVVPNLYSLKLKDGYVQRFSLCYISILKLVEQLNLKTVAIPPLGIGHCGWRLEEMAQICIDSILWYLAKHPNTVLQELVLVCRNEVQKAAYKNYLESEELKNKFTGADNIE